MNRRKFLTKSGFLAALSLGRPITGKSNLSAQIPLRRVGASELKTSVNLYSFNKILRSAEMSLEHCLDFCAETGFGAVDITGYYLKGYPEVPADDYLYAIKRQCHLLGMDISGTGVRNDFTVADAGKRKADVELIKRWIEVAAKLGAPLIRVFAGREMPKEYTKDQMREWAVQGFRECADYGKKFGIIVAVQNHASFIKTAEEVKRILKMVNHRWFGLVADIGSFPTADPYEEVRQVVPFAVNWQIKEALKTDQGSEKTDLKRIFRILREGDYRGYIPIETLGEGDPRQKVPQFFREVKEALSA